MSSSKTAARPDKPLVSIIVPAYNYGRFIGAAVESLQAQTLTNWECLVVDDGSTDDTADVVARFATADSRIKLFHQQNRRQAAARNFAFEQMSGKYVQFLDADDLLEPRKFEQQVEYLEAHPEVDIVYSDTRFFQSERPEELLYTMHGENIPWQPGFSGTGVDMLLPLVRRNTVIICAPLTRTALVQRVGHFDEQLPGLEDWEFWIRCALAGANFRYEDNDGTRALVRSHPSSSSKNKLRIAAAEVRMRSKLTRLLAPESDASRTNAQLLAEADGILGAHEVMYGGRGRGVYQLAKAAVLDRNFRHRLKWLACAIAAPFVAKSRFERIYSSSISRAVMSPLSRLQENGQR